MKSFQVLTDFTVSSSPWFFGFRISPLSFWINNECARSYHLLSLKGKGQRLRSAKNGTLFSKHKQITQPKRKVTTILRETLKEWKKSWVSQKYLIIYSWLCKDMINIFSPRSIHCFLRFSLGLLQKSVERPPKHGEKGLFCASFAPSPFKLLLPRWKEGQGSRPRWGHFWLEATSERTDYYRPLTKA